eukprot:14297201-Alexandrium_andersonii.AAC.1
MAEADCPADRTPQTGPDRATGGPMPCESCGQPPWQARARPSRDIIKYPAAGSRGVRGREAI